MRKIDGFNAMTSPIIWGVSGGLVLLLVCLLLVVAKATWCFVVGGCAP